MNRTRLMKLGVLVGLMAAVPLSIRSESTSPNNSNTKNPAAQPGAKAPPKPVYRPPMRGAPSERANGGTRGQANTALVLTVLAPDDTGLTTSEQPSLFWYQSQPANAKFELTMIEENGIKPVLELTLDGAKNAGIQRLDLAKRSIKLSPGVEYQWAVALVTDPENRSKDVVASGTIKRVASSASLQEKLAKADKALAPNIYAEEGIWYDAVETLSNQIEAQPGNKALRENRAALLEQVGLKAAAAYDKKAAME